MRLALVLLLALTAPASAGEIRGVVVFKGTPPQRATVDRTAEPRCPQDALAEDVVVVEGKVQDVLVRVIKGPKRALDDHPVPTEPVVIDQDGCAYRPRVAGARAGQTLEIRNSDPLFHNVRGSASDAVAFNLPQPAKGKPIVRALGDDAVTALACDVHPWMKAWIVRVDHPHFAVTGADGAFVLPDLPPGSYVLEAWHPTLGRQTTKVVVKKGKKAAKATLTFRASK